MNPVTFNEPFELALKKLKDPARAELEVAIPRWRCSPLFVHETTVAEERDFITNYLDQPGDVPMPDVKWPFPVLRLSITERTGPGDEALVPTKCNMVLSHVSEDEIIVFCHYLYIGLSNGRMRELEPIFTLSKSNPAMGGMRTMAYIKKAWSKEILGNRDHPDEDGKFNTVPEDTIRQFAVSRVSVVVAFMIAATSPRIHIATVEPVIPNGKSVEWQKARMHYTFISHGHPANKAGVEQGSEVTSDAAEELKRLAHDRRGHWRTYRHQRYRFARGLRQWIKATWVGPKEWKSAGGKQIYRILEEVPFPPE